MANNIFSPCPEIRFFSETGFFKKSVSLLCFGLTLTCTSLLSLFFLSLPSHVAATFQPLIHFLGFRPLLPSDPNENMNVKYRVWLIKHILVFLIVLGIMYDSYFKLTVKEKKKILQPSPP